MLRFFAAVKMVPLVLKRFSSGRHTQGHTKAELFQAMS